LADQPAHIDEAAQPAFEPSATKRLENWPACLDDADVAKSVLGFTLYGYEQSKGGKVGLYRSS